MASSAGVGVAPVVHEPTYFETQQWSRCALHTLNNLLQRRAFMPGDLDAICESLTPRRWFNPHRSLLPGMGNYDVNVLMAALGQQRLTLRWYDRRRPLASCEFASLYGLILNVPSRSFGALGARHWYAVKRFPNGDWYAMDSDAPGDRAKAKVHAGKKPTPADQATKIEHVRHARSSAARARARTHGHAGSAQEGDRPLLTLRVCLCLLLLPSFLPSFLPLSSLPT